MGLPTSLATRRALSRGLWVSIAVSLVALGALVVYAQRHDALEQLEAVRPRYLAASLLIIAAAWWVKSYRTRLLALALGHSLPMRRLFSHYMASAFVSHVTPSSGGGLPLYIWLIHRDGLSIGSATAVGLLDASLIILVALFAAPLVLLLLRQHISFPLLSEAAAAGALLAVMLAVGAIYGLWRPQAFSSAGRWLGRRRWIARLIRPERLAAAGDRIAREAEVFRGAMGQMLLRSPGLLVASVLLTVVYWLLYLSIASVIMMGLGLRVDWVKALVAQLAFNAFQPLIPTPGGSGGAELTLAALFRFLVPARQLAVFVAAWRVVTFYASLLVGLFCFIRSTGSSPLSARPSGEAAGPGIDSGQAEAAPSSTP